MNGQQPGPRVGREGLRPEVEVDEHELVIYESYLAGSGPGPYEEAQVEAARECAASIAQRSWFRGLTVEELRDLSVLPGWDWHRLYPFDPVSAGVEEAMQYYAERVEEELSEGLPMDYDITPDGEQLLHLEAEYGVVLNSRLMVVLGVRRRRR